MANTRIRRSEAYQAVADICDDLGVPHQIKIGRKHHKVKFTVCGKPFSIVVSGSPSGCCYQDSRHLTIRLLRQAGVQLPERV
jgi:hypothetical protein